MGAQTNTDQSITDLQRSSVASAMHFAQMSMETSQRILQVQAEAVKELLETSLASARELAVAKSPQEAMDLRMRFAQQCAQKMLESGRNVGEITVGMHAEMTKMMAEQLGQGKNGFLELTQSMMKSLPLAAPPATKALLQVFNAAQQAFTQMAQTSTSSFTSAAVSSEAQKTSRKRDGSQ